MKKRSRYCLSACLLAACLLAACSWASHALADVSSIRPASYLPDANTVVLTLAKQHNSSDAETLLTTLKQARQNQDTAKTEALLEQAAPYLQGQRPAELRLQAEIFDYLHNFDSALSATQQLIQQSHPRHAKHGQLRLQAINLSIAAGQYQQVGEHCRPLAASLGRDWSQVCMAMAAGLNSQTASALEQQYQQLAALTITGDAQRWQQRSLAEFAWRLGWLTEVDKHCEQLLASASEAWSSARYAETSAFCAQQLAASQPEKALRWLRPAANSLAVAVQKLQLQALGHADFADELPALQRLLQQEHYLLGIGQSQHHREVAQYLLLQGSFNAAAEVAKQNWQQQKFLLDAALLKQALAANREPEAMTDQLALPYFVTAAIPTSHATRD